MARSPRPARSVGNAFLREHAIAERKALMLSVLFGVLASIAMLVQWLSFAFLAEQIIVFEADLQKQISLLTVLALSLLSRPLLQKMQTIHAQKASTHIRSHVRQNLLDKWRNTNPVLLKTMSKGVLASQFIEHVESLDGYYSRYWPQQSLAVISPLLILGVVFYLNWLCALLLLISAPLIPLFMVLVGMGAESLNQKYALQRQRLAGHFLDRVSALSTIRLLGAQQEIMQEVLDSSNRYRNIIMRTLRLAFLSSTVLEFFTSVAIAALAIYIGFSLYGAITWGPAESLSLFSGLAILILAPEFFQPLRTLSQFYHDRATALGAAHHLHNALQPVDDITYSIISDAGLNTDLSSLSQAVTLSMHDLSIGYNTSEVCLTNLNLKAHTGQLVIISGQSGSGKTALLNTLAGYIKPIKGSINIEPSTGKNHALLPQSPWIKNASIRDNLLALAPHASDQQMLDALSLLGLLEELNTKHKGLDTLIGEHTAGLSGGQLQRIAFARILLKPSPVVLLDEPTAKLDIQSGTFVIKAINQLKQESLVIVATHDETLIQQADLSINTGTHGVALS